MRSRGSKGAAARDGIGVSGGGSSVVELPLLLTGAVVDAFGVRSGMMIALAAIDAVVSRQATPLVQTTLGCQDGCQLIVALADGAAETAVTALDVHEFVTGDTPLARAVLEGVYVAARDLAGVGLAMGEGLGIDNIVLIARRITRVAGNGGNMEVGRRDVAMLAAAQDRLVALPVANLLKRARVIVRLPSAASPMTALRQSVHNLRRALASW